MAPSPWKPGPDQGENRTKLYESTYSRRGKRTCTRRMAIWLSDLPSPTRRPWSLSASEPCIDERESENQPNMGAQTGLEDTSNVAPRPRHEDPLRQHPIRQLQLPIRLHVPQRQSSLPFRHKNSHHSLQSSAPTGPPQLASPQKTNTSYLQLGVPIQTTTTGFHLNYRYQTRTSGQQLGVRPQTTITDSQFDYPQHATARPGSAALEQKHVPGLQSVYHGSKGLLAPHAYGQVLDAQILAQFNPLLQNPVTDSELGMQGQDACHLAKDTASTNFQPQIPSCETAYAATMLHRQASQMSQVRQLFGRDTAKEEESRKRARSETPGTMASRPPSKRVRGAITSARHRLSRVMTPAGDAGAGGRQSRLDRLTDAAKRMSLAPSPQMVRVVDFAPGVAKETVKVAILGNSGVGKTKLVQAFRTGSYEEEAMEATSLHQTADGDRVITTNVVLDGIPVALETWDVSSQCDETKAYGNSIRPLLATFYDVVILCYDVSDETSLKAVKSKWAHNAERYCTGAPTILLGLKIDLRRPFPSLRLSHLQEPSQTSTGQGEAAGKQMVVEAFYEVSAKTGEGVADFFESVARFALQRRRGRGRGRSRGPVSRVKRVLKGLKKDVMMNMQY